MGIMNKGQSIAGMYFGGKRISGAIFATSKVWQLMPNLWRLADSTPAFINMWGDLQAPDARQLCSPLIPVQAGKIYTVAARVAVPNGARWWSASFFYDSNGKPVGSRSTKAIDGKTGDVSAFYAVTAPAGAAYIRACASFLMDGGRAMIFKGNQQIDWGKYPIIRG